MRLNPRSCLGSLSKDGHHSDMYYNRYTMTLVWRNICITLYITYFFEYHISYIIYYILCSILCILYITCIWYRILYMLSCILWYLILFMGKSSQMSAPRKTPWTSLRTEARPRSSTCRRPPIAAWPRTDLVMSELCLAKASEQANYGFILTWPRKTSFGLARRSFIPHIHRTESKL